MPSPQTLVDIKKSLDVCTSIFDEEYLKVLSSVPAAMWKIAGAFSLPGWEPHSGPTSDIVQLSQATGLSVQDILEILDESPFFFDVSPSKLGQQYSIDIWIKLELRTFLLDEARSRGFYSKYRTSVILEFRSRILIFEVISILPSKFKNANTCI